MSWGRVDDTFWDHEKTQALLDQGPEGLEAIGALWVIISYCQRVHRDYITEWEVPMLLHRCAEDGVVVLERLVPPPSDEFETGFLVPKCFEADQKSMVKVLPKQWFVHDLSDYRSKNGSKVSSGRKGGIISGKVRRSKREAPHEAPGDSASKQTRSPDPDPETRSRDPNPIPRPSEKVKSVPIRSGDPVEWSRGQVIDHPSKWNVASEKLGLAITPSRAEKELATRLIKAGAIEPHEYESAMEALEQARGKKQIRIPGRYVLTTIENQRQEAADIASGTSPPPTKKPGPPRKGPWAREL